MLKPRTIILWGALVGISGTFASTMGWHETRDSLAPAAPRQDDPKADAVPLLTSIPGMTDTEPVFHYTTTKTTAVDVPDGGTVLLRGLKLLSEGRKENGVPMLSQLPCTNGRPKDVATGRSVESLMKMVTPRIIIKEEEEDKLGLAPSK